MSDDDSFDKLLPWQSQQRQIGHIETNDSDDKPDGRNYDSDDCFSTASNGSLLHNHVYDKFGHAVVMRTVFALTRSHQKTTLMMVENLFQSWPLSYQLSNTLI